METKQAGELSESERYEYLIKQAVAKKEIWLLQAHDGFYAMFEDDNGQSYIPVWPDKASAEAYAKDDWDGYTADTMEIDEFLDWLQELKNDQIMIGAFPNAGSQTFAVDAIELKKLLKRTMSAASLQ